jgi:geranylgeranyl pyrophosphate synthase
MRGFGNRVAVLAGDFARAVVVVSANLDSLEVVKPFQKWTRILLRVRFNKG